jgi:hypothetical protein
VGPPEYGDGGEYRVREWPKAGGRRVDALPKGAVAAQAMNG